MKKIDPYRRGVDLLEADGVQDIGASFSYGDSRSEYGEGHDEDTYKKNGNATLSPSSNPHSGSMWGGNSGITVKVNSTIGDVMSVTITFASRTGQVSGVAYTGPLTAADMDGDGTEELLASRADSLTIADMNRGRTLSLPSGSHPVVIPASDSGRTVFALSQGNRIQFYGLNDFIPELLAGISIPDLNGASPIWTGAPLYTRSSSGGHLLVAVQYAKGGQATDSAILNIALKNFPEVTATSISLPDTARIVRMAAADDFVAAAGANGVLHTGLLD